MRLKREFRIKELRTLGLLIIFLLIFSNCTLAQNKEKEAEQYFNQGYKLLKAKHYAEAIEFFKKSNAISPDATNYYNLGVCYQNLENYQDAVTAYKQSIRLDPSDADAHGNLANALYSQGNYAESAAEYREAVRLQPNDKINKKGLADAEQALAQQGESKTLSIGSKSSNSTLDSSDNFYVLGRIYYKEQDWKRAIKAFEQAKKISPQNTDVLFSLGSAYWGDQQYSKAAAEYREVQRLRPSYPNVGKYLAEAEELARQQRDAKIDKWTKALGGVNDALSTPTQSGNQTGGGTQTQTGSAPGTLAGTSWSLLSMTETGKREEQMGSTPNVQFCRDGNWTILYSTHAESGSYRMQESDLVMGGDPFKGTYQISRSGNDMILKGGGWVYHLRYYSPVRC